MTRVLYGYEAFDMQRFGGVSRCFVELYKHLPADIQATFGLVESDNVYMQSLGFKPMQYTYNHFLPWLQIPHKSYLFHKYNALKGVYYGTYYGTDENRRRSIQLLNSGSFDVFHPTFFDDYFLPYLNGTPFVLTIHDMIPELYPEFYPRSHYQILQKRKLAPLANKIIAVSESTKRDIVRLLDIPEDKIEVVYHGVNREDFVWRERAPIEYPYILFVGARGMYKNFLRMAKDLLPVFDKYKDLKVVCTGLPFSQEELSWMNQYAKDRFIHIFAQSGADLATLYRHAKAFIYPSAYEGFGIPILEAYMSECPVLLNDASCFPEIAGDAALYFDLNDFKSTLTTTVMDLMEMNSSDRANFIGRQNKQLLLYSWDKSADKLANIYRNIR